MLGVLEAHDCVRSCMVPTVMTEEKEQVGIIGGA